MMKLNLETDIPILKFLWTWKLLSTTAIAARFYPGSNLRAPYVRLWKLERGGFIKSIASSNGKGFVWALSARGFATIRHSLPLLTEEGFKSEHLGHDIAVTAAHLGDWIMHAPEGVEFVTEQELRRFDKEALPEWLPDTDLHRPDGYWRIRIGDKLRVLALEVELSQKALDRYENIARFYSEDAEACHVIWIVDGKQLMNRVHQKIRDYIGTARHLHSFCLFSEFQKLGWQTKIESGNAIGQTLANRLLILPEFTLKDSSGLSFFDLRKNPVNSATHTHVPNHDFFNCVAPLPFSPTSTKGLLTL